MTVCMSLFRGINVGGHHKVSMDELKRLHESLGLREVVTYIQSGNVVFSCDDEGDVAQLRERIEEGFAQKFGFQVKVVVRTLAELEAIIVNNPFQDQPDKEANLLHVLFLAASLESTMLEELQRAYAGPEEIYLRGHALYIYYVDGAGRSKLTLPLIEKKLKTAGTARNWNTVLQLQKMMQNL